LKRAKDPRSFTVTVRLPGRAEPVRDIAFGETFFLARARRAVELHVEPEAIRLEPPRRFS
jgi:hypothetical protein